ncbi:hypothetical protein GGX14DRAFT_553700 [Mycena pura]|uniref:Uncharacterized protein n=1 Tax=Mycena pura TaxID=153505 RepID=A0AAD6YV72_9AGAR|nr:hypothetical protein GGX14DRAFT_553700 [Mycena pura]
MAQRLLAVARAKSPYRTTLLRGWSWAAHAAHHPRCLSRSDLFMNRHPQLVDDCPCFEDTIAIGSVVLDMLLGRWSTHTPGLGAGAAMLGSGWAVDVCSGAYIRVACTSIDVGIWWAAVAVSKMVFRA